MRITRRRFVLGTLLLGAGGVALGRVLMRTMTEEGARTVRALCDRFVPGHATAPSASSLGIDREIFELLCQRRRDALALVALAWSLEWRGFDGLAAGEQDALLSAELAAVAEAEAAKRPPPRTSKIVESVYRECTRRYLTRPEAWGALAYRIPQPHGYPDYTECPAS